MTKRMSLVVVERQFDYPRQSFPGLDRPAAAQELARQSGWHVEEETLSGDLRLGGRHGHVKVRDNDPNTRVGTDGVYTEYFEPDVFVSRRADHGDPGIDPTPLELRVRVHQKRPRRDAVADHPGTLRSRRRRLARRGLEKELTRLANYLAGTGGMPQAAPDEHDPGEVTHSTIVRQKPLMNMRQILLMNFGFFGIQYSFGMQQTAVNPIFQFLHAKPEELPILNLAGPMTGLLIQPMIGALSDKTWSPGEIPAQAVLPRRCHRLFGLPLRVPRSSPRSGWPSCCSGCFDASNNTAMEPYRAFIADKLPPSQLGKGFLAQSFFTGFGITLANISLFVFQKLITGATSAGIPYWVVGCSFSARCAPSPLSSSPFSRRRNPFRRRRRSRP